MGAPSGTADVLRAQELADLGWDPATVGELDHRRLKVPSVKLRSATRGPYGDVAYCVDFRLRRPNAGDYLTSTELHSLEHFLLHGLRRLLPANFLSIGIMGCQTGFYLVLLNEGRTAKICAVLERILGDIQTALAVPYARIEQCGNYRNHSLTRAQDLARQILAAKSHWLEVA